MDFSLQRKHSTVRERATAPVKESQEFLSTALSCTESKGRWKSRHYFSQVMSAILQLLDDQSSSSKLLGISYLNRVLELEDVSVLDNLDAMGYFDVLFEAIFRLTHHQDVDVLNCVYPCLINILRASEQDGRKIPDPKYGQLSPADQLLLQSLKHITLFTAGEIRACVVEHTINLMDYLEIRAAKFLPRLLSTTEILIGAQVESQQLLALSLHSAAAVSCWPFFITHMEQILLQLMKIVLQNEKSNGSTILEKVSALFALLLAVDSSVVGDFVTACLQRHPFSNEFASTMSALVTAGLNL